MNIRCRFRSAPLPALLLLVTGCADERAPSGEDLTPSETAVRTLHLEAGPGSGARLQALLDTLEGPARVALGPGRYRLEPVAFTDPSCGNCQDPAETVPATRGLRLRGRGIELVGRGSPDEVVIETRSGYGVLFDGCQDCALAKLTITGGIRDADGRATDAGVVVRNGAVTVEDCVVRDNLGDSATVHSVVVGVGGVMVREEGDLTLRRCRILRNSWDGVALYRGARATLVQNVIDGVDAASGGRHGGGRGVGIGVTWDGRATAVGNRVTRYWKGIGAFVDARVEVRENVVEDILTWGIAYWGPDAGEPRAEIVGNVVYRTGACGISVDRTAPPDPGEDPGRVAGNVLVETGRNEAYDDGEPYCHQRPVARHAVPAGFDITDNVLFRTRQPGEAWPVQPEVEDRPAFLDAAGPVVERLRRHPPFTSSRFARDVLAPAEASDAAAVSPGTRDGPAAPGTDAAAPGDGENDSGGNGTGDRPVGRPG